MKLQALKEEILDTMRKAIKEAIYEGDDMARDYVNTNDGYFDIAVFKSGRCAVAVCHDDQKKLRVDDNIETFAESLMKELKWSDVEKDVKSENAEPPEQEYARRGEAMFARSMQWHRI